MFPRCPRGSPTWTSRPATARPRPPRTSTAVTPRGHGCENSSSTGGALLSVTGTASLAADTLVFSSTGEPSSSLSILLQGDAVHATTSFGDGLRCSGGALKRLYAYTSVGGVVSAPQ